MISFTHFMKQHLHNYAFFFFLHKHNTSNKAQSHLFWFVLIIQDIIVRYPKSHSPTKSKCVYVCVCLRVVDSLHKPNSVSHRLSIKPQGR